MREPVGRRDIVERHFDVFERLAAMRNADPRTPLILYSGSMTEELAIEAGDFGVAAVLETPISIDRLVEAVRAVAAPQSGTPAAP